MSRPSKIARAQEPEVVRRYQSGETLQQLGLQFGCSDTSVGRVLKKNGVLLRPCHRRAALGSEELAKLVQLYRNGATTTELGVKYGCSSKHIGGLLRKQGVDTRKPPKVPLGDRRALVAEYDAGASLNELAERWGCSQRTIAKALREAGAIIRDQGNVPSPLDPELVVRIVALASEGHFQGVIAEKVGCPVGVVSRVLRDREPTSKPCGPRHPFWKGGRAATGQGYVLAYMPAHHPFAPQMRRSNGYCLEHRLVMAEHLGRPLRRSETVHHVNGDKTDNRIENLQIRHGKHGANEHFRCLECGSMNVIAVEL